MKSYVAPANRAAPTPYSVTAVTYDPQNLPLSITRSGTTAVYRYDDTGERIAKQVGTGNTELYVRDGAITLGVFTVDGSGAPVSSYFNLVWEDRVVGRHTSAGTRTYYHFDALGSTRAVVLSTTNAVVEAYDFEPWGLLMPGRTLAGPTKEGFSGKEQDTETGLDYFGARFYMPAVRRWAAVDPLAHEFPEWTPYNYVFNSPIQHVDPTGAAVDDWYVDDNGDVSVNRTNDSFDRFYVQDDKSGTHYVLAAQLDKNAAGLVSFPNAGVGFDRYGDVDVGGTSTNPPEVVGNGDHYLKPEVAARLFGLANALNSEHGFVLSFGDFSSSNGSDPWEEGQEHHAGRGHGGTRSGLDVDFRYLNAQGRGFQDQDAMRSSNFSAENNQRVYDAANRFGFWVNYQGPTGNLTGVSNVEGHDNHGHLGAGRRP